MSKKYLLNITFYAGSDDPSDTDTGLFLLESNKVIIESEIKEIFKTVNNLLDPYEEHDFPISYEQGLNLKTLVEGVRIYTKDTIEPVKNNHFDSKPILINNFYVIEQWQ